MGRIFNHRSLSAAIGASTLCTLAVAPQSWAQPEDDLQPVQAVEPVEALEEDATGDSVSAVVGADFFTHFISYGDDIWNEGEAFSGSETLNPYAEVSIAVNDVISFTVGTWWDVNDNATSGIGGDLQEVDVYFGAGIALDKFTFGVTYQEWLYGGQTEDILDISVGFDDTGLISEDFSLSPTVIVHNRVSGDGLEEGTIVVVGVEPSVTVFESEDMTLDVAIPISVAYLFEEEYFGPGLDDGFAYVSVGAAISIPLPIDTQYGEWAANAGITYYYTEEEVYANPDDSIVVFNAGLSLAF